MRVAFIKSKVDRNVSRKKNLPKNEAFDRQDNTKACVTAYSTVVTTYTLLIANSEQSRSRILDA